MRTLLFLFVSFTLNAYAAEDDDLAAKRWFATETTHFVVYSQLLRGQTERQARNLEQWRDAALQVLGIDTAEATPFKTYFYLFDSSDDFGLFADGADRAYLFSSPRANYIIAQSDARGIEMAQHHYAHFLINNRPIGVPRWFEEGMSQYLSRMQVDNGDVELKGIEADNYSLLANLNASLSLDDLIYDDTALASPRLIQIANLKAAIFVQFLLHGHEREGFADRRDVLQAYLGFLQQGRTERFAYDQAFNLSTSRLETEFTRFIEEAAKRGDRDQEIFESLADYSLDAHEATREEIELALAEVSLQAGRFPLSAYYFDRLVKKGAGGGRAYSGFADAQRMNLSDSEDASERAKLQELALLYQQAIESDPQDPQLYLDFGQYYDAQRDDCERPLNPAELRTAQDVMTSQFTQALALAPDSAEVNLSYGQLFLFEGKNWQEGLVYQNKAFERLPSDTFVLEQMIEYAILEQDYTRAETLINRMARPMHFYGTPIWVTHLRNQLRAAERGQVYDPCAEVPE